VNALSAFKGNSGKRGTISVLTEEDGVDEPAVSLKIFTELFSLTGFLHFTFPAFFFFSFFFFSFFFLFSFLDRKSVV
jgi:hypothetical protein